MILQEENFTKHFDTLLPLLVTDELVYPRCLGERHLTLLKYTFPSYLFSPLLSHIKLISEQVAFAFKVNFILFPSFLHCYLPTSEPYYLYLGPN